MIDILLKIPHYSDFFRTSNNSHDKTLYSFKPSIAYDNIGVWFAQACEALERMHEAGIAHGFLSDHHLLIDETTNILRIGNIDKSQPYTDDFPHEEFDAHNLIYAPERLLAQGKRGEIPFNTMYESLERENYAIDVIHLSFHDIDYDREILKKIYENVENVDKRKSDVWMLAYSFLKYYRNYLMMWSQTLSTNFYRTEHLRFMEILEGMLLADPDKRLTAAKAFSRWTGSSIPMLKHDEFDAADGSRHEEKEKEPTDGTHHDELDAADGSRHDEKEPTDVTHHDEKEKEQTDVTHHDEKEKEQEQTVSVSQPVAVQKRRRLVLNLQRDPSGRSRTRKNLHN
jgi:serine/threonine protein kinase